MGTEAKEIILCIILIEKHKTLRNKFNKNQSVGTISGGTWG